MNLALSFMELTDLRLEQRDSRTSACDLCGVKDTFATSTTYRYVPVLFSNILELIVSVLDLEGAVRGASFVKYMTWQP